MLDVFRHHLDRVARLDFVTSTINESQENWLEVVRVSFQCLNRS
jgi:hypothetical protein